MYSYKAIASLAFASVLGATACSSPDENSTGSEYMPDMAHSVAYEANTFFEYYQNTWDSASVKSKYDLAQPGVPVNGTIPRGYAGYYLAGINQNTGQTGATSSDFADEKAAMDEVYGLTGKVQAISTPINGSAPYYYKDTESDRIRAVADLQQNPFPITVDGLKRGAELYNIFCAICHGENGGGNGTIYENGAYPAAPANFLQESWVDTSAGLYYHAMMHGKNVMGSYKDKVSYEERWQIIHHIRALQAKEFEKAYSADANDMIADEANPIANSPQYAQFLESFSPEPIEVESQESSAPNVVGGPAPGEQVQQGMIAPGALPDSVATQPSSTATDEVAPGGSSEY